MVEVVMRQAEVRTDGKKEEIGVYIENKAGYTATPVACRWVGAVFEVTRPFGQEQ